MTDEEKELQVGLYWEAMRVKEELDSALSKNDITESIYNKSIVELCHKYILQGLSDYSLNLLLFTTPDYFSTSAIAQMKDDPAFFDKCSFIFEILDYLGYIPIDVFATQSHGKA